MYVATLQLLVDLAHSLRRVLVLARSAQLVPTSQPFERSSATTVNLNSSQRGKEQPEYMTVVSLLYLQTHFTKSS